MSWKDTIQKVDESQQEQKGSWRDTIKKVDEESEEIQKFDSEQSANVPEEDSIAETATKAVTGPVTGYVAGALGSNVISGTQRALKRGAENLAFKAVGAELINDTQDMLGKTSERQISRSAKKIYDDLINAENAKRASASTLEKLLTASSGKPMSEGERLSFLKEQMGDTGLGVTKKGIGRKVLDEGLLGTFGLKGTENALRKHEKINDIEKQNLDDFLSSKPDKTPISDIVQKIQNKYDTAGISPTGEKTLDKGGVAAYKEMQDRVNILQNHPIKELSLSQIEDRKREAAIGYDPSSKKIEDAAQGKYVKTWRDIPEEIIEQKYGKEALEEFIKLKSQSGSNAVIGTALSNKLRMPTEGFAPSLGELLLGGGVKRASIFGNVLRKGSAVGAKALDYASKIAKPAAKVGRYLPAVGGILGAAATFNEAKAAGLDTKESAIRAAADAVSPIGMPSEETIQAQSMSKRDIMDRRLIPSDMSSASPEKLMDMFDKAQQSGDKGMADFIQNYTQGNETKRTSMMFSALQNPDMKKKLMKLLEE